MRLENQTSAKRKKEMNREIKREIERKKNTNLSRVIHRIYGSFDVVRRDEMAQLVLSRLDSINLTQGHCQSFLSDGKNN